MQIPPPWRIGIYLILVGVALDLALWHFGIISDELGFSALLLPAGIFMAFVWSLGRFYESTAWTTGRVPLTTPGRPRGELLMDSGTQVSARDQQNSFAPVSPSFTAITGIILVLLGTVVVAAGRLIVRTDDYEYCCLYAYPCLSLAMPFVELIAILGGLGLLLRSLATHIANRKARAGDLMPSNALPLDAWRPCRQLPLPASIRALPSFGLLGVMSLSSVSLFMFHRQIFYEETYGLRVSVVRPGFQVVETRLGWGHPLVEIDSLNHWFLDGKRISRDELPDALRNDLKSRADRRVFLEAAREIDVKDAISAMDIIHQAQGEVVMVTPRAIDKTAHRLGEVDEIRTPAQ